MTLRAMPKLLLGKGEGYSFDQVAPEIRARPSEFADRQQGPMIDHDRRSTGDRRRCAAVLRDMIRSMATPRMNENRHGRRRQATQKLKAPAHP